MTLRAARFHPVVAALCAAVLAIGLTPAAHAQAAPPPGPDPAATQPASPPETPAARLDRLFDELKAPAPPGDDSWRRAESDILRLWSQSGSANIDLLRRRGVAALDEGDATAAIGHLTALLDHAPGFAAARVDRAAAYAAHGDFGPAADDLAEALRIEPRQFLALTQLGTMLDDMGHPAAALRAFQASLAINPHQSDAVDAAHRLTQTLGGIPI